MSRKNFKVETAKDGQTTITKIEKKESNVPTGKIKTAEELTRAVSGHHDGVGVVIRISGIYTQRHYTK